MQRDHPFAPALPRGSGANTPGCRKGSSRCATGPTSAMAVQPAMSRRQREDPVRTLEGGAVFSMTTRSMPAVAPGDAQSADERLKRLRTAASPFARSQRAPLHHRPSRIGRGARRSGRPRRPRKPRSIPERTPLRSPPVAMTDYRAAAPDGTGGSNPVPSSGEFLRNLTFRNRKSPGIGATREAVSG